MLEIVIFLKEDLLLDHLATAAKLSRQELPLHKETSRKFANLRN